jgi:predicted ester cyclase
MSMKTLFSDNSFTSNEMVAEADKMVVRMTMNGTHTEPVTGLPAFGRLDQPVPPRASR